VKSQWLPASDYIEVEAPAQRCDEYWRDRTQLPTIFEDKGDRCAITVSMKYDPPGGKVGEMGAKLTSRNPEEQARRALESFKRVVEGWSKAA
jgi:uncharacterized membrane protein